MHPLNPSLSCCRPRPYPQCAYMVEASRIPLEERTGFGCPFALSDLRVAAAIVAIHREVSRRRAAGTLSHVAVELGVALPPAER